MSAADMEYIVGKGPLAKSDAVRAFFRRVKLRTGGKFRIYDEVYGEVLTIVKGMTRCDVEGLLRKIEVMGIRGKQYSPHVSQPFDRAAFGALLNVYANRFFADDTDLF